MAESHSWVIQVTVTETLCNECKGWTTIWTDEAAKVTLRVQRNHLRTCSTNALFNLNGESHE